MLINRRNALTAGGKLSAKSYVQDGLVAMWDGIENAGWGVHDAAATTWKDLVGNKILSLTSNGSWGDDCLVCNGQSRGAYGDNLTSDAPVAVEAVFKTDASPSSWRIIWHQSAWRSGNTVARCFVFSNVYFILSSVSGRIVSPPSDFANPKSISVKYDGMAAIDAHVNGSSVAVSPSNSSWFASDGGYVFTLGGGTSNTYAIACRIYSLRLYSRALTADEIAANCAVDKARFSLPDAT